MDRYSREKSSEVLDQGEGRKAHLTQIELRLELPVMQDMPAATRKHRHACMARITPCHLPFCPSLQPVFLTSSASMSSASVDAPAARKHSRPRTQTLKRSPCPFGTLRVKVKLVCPSLPVHVVSISFYLLPLLSPLSPASSPPLSPSSSLPSITFLLSPSITPSLPTIALLPSPPYLPSPLSPLSPSLSLTIIPILPLSPIR